jgi:hypothetical protein
MVGHEAEAVEPRAEALATFFEQGLEALAVGLGKEDIRAAVAAQHHVVEAAGDVKAGFADHGERLIRAGQ